MPRGTCEYCGQRDVFVFPMPLAFGRQSFVCVQCFRPPEPRHKDDERESQAKFQREDPQTPVAGALGRFSGLKKQAPC